MKSDFRQINAGKSEQIFRFLFWSYLVVVLLGTVYGRTTYEKDPLRKFWEDWTVYYKDISTEYK